MSSHINALFYYKKYRARRALYRQVQLATRWRWRVGRALHAGLRQGGAGRDRDGGVEGVGKEEEKDAVAAAMVWFVARRAAVCSADRALLRLDWASLGAFGQHLRKYCAESGAASLHQPPANLASELQEMSSEGEETSAGDRGRGTGKRRRKNRGRGGKGGMAANVAAPVMPMSPFPPGIFPGVAAGPIPGAVAPPLTGSVPAAVPGQVGGVAPGQIPGPFPGQAWSPFPPGFNPYGAMLYPYQGFPNPGIATGVQTQPSQANTGQANTGRGDARRRQKRNVSRDSDVKWPGSNYRGSKFDPNYVDPRKAKQQAAAAAAHPESANVASKTEGLTVASPLPMPSVPGSLKVDSKEADDKKATPSTAADVGDDGVGDDDVGDDDVVDHVMELVETARSRGYAPHPEDRALFTVEALQETVNVRDFVLQQAEENAFLRFFLVSRIGGLAHVVDCLSHPYLYKNLDPETDQLSSLFDLDGESQKNGFASGESNAGMSSSEWEQGEGPETSEDDVGPISSDSDKQDKVNDSDDDDNDDDDDDNEERDKDEAGKTSTPGETRDVSAK
ncbi:hypothetical protein FVE85_5442 [Porphyridium purpureum]|uniref:Uncharacterized protein n=1 Tax=Porphyridium purpureum TaxID=35688 RepID=A0A5J4Z5F6_PORPP|nr:hypothetical protein FVE85_5442 [Porphyridium purpureum]|eukprot:POR0095..scf295_1